MARNRIVRRSFGGRSRSPGRLTEWFASADVALWTALGASVFIFDSELTAAEKAKRPFTITRTVGSVWMHSDQQAATEEPFGAVGMMVVSDKAAALGVTALPSPILQESSDEWFVYGAFAATAGTVEGAPVARLDFDSRAQRKVVDGETIVVMLENGSSAFGFTYVIKFRMLVKLS